MFKRILVPLDGSLRAERALPVAADLTRAGSGESILTRIVTAPVLPGQDSAQYPSAEAILAGERETAIRYLKDVSQRPELADVATHREVREAAAVAPALLDLIQSAHADLVVICSHGRTGFQRWSLGSVAQKIARHATVPTLVLRSDGPNLMSATGDGQRSMRALAPLDGSPEAETALEPTAQVVAALAAPGQGALHLLHVVQMEDATDMASNAKQSLQQEAEMYLRGVAERLTRAPLAGLSLMVTWSVICDPDVASAIIAAAEGKGEATNADDQASAPPCDMIAMASHGRSGYELWAMGSVTERVLHTSALPLLIVSPATTHPDTHGSDEGASEIEWMRDR